MDASQIMRSPADQKDREPTCDFVAHLKRLVARLLHLYVGSKAGVIAVDSASHAAHSRQQPCK